MNLFQQSNEQSFTTKLKFLIINSFFHNFSANFLGAQIGAPANACVKRIPSFAILSIKGVLSFLFPIQDSSKYPSSSSLMKIIFGLEEVFSFKYEKFKKLSPKVDRPVWVKKCLLERFFTSTGKLLLNKNPEK